MDEKDKKILMDAFQRTFSTNDGQLVLTHMLNELGYFATDGTQDPKMVSFGNWILMRIGAYSLSTLEEYVRRITGAE